VIMVLAGAALVLAGLVGTSAVLQPGCVSCHMPGDFATASLQAPHAAVECTDCHGGSSAPSRVASAAQQVFGMYVPVVPLDPTTAWVDSSRCRECHATQVEAVVDARGLRISHVSCAVGRECTDCHATVGHG